MFVCVCVCVCVCMCSVCVCVFVCVVCTCYMCIINTVLLLVQSIRKVSRTDAESLLEKHGRYDVNVCIDITLNNLSCQT